MMYQRGLNQKQINSIIKNDELMNILHNHNPELFCGIRNGYFNLYFQCASAGKFFPKSDGKIQVSLHKKYWKPGSGSGYITIPLEQFLSHHQSILQNIRHVEKSRRHSEKIIQQHLVQANNNYPNSKWYCVDLEYIQQRRSKEEPCFGRFDIIALSKEPDENQKYQAALIELKVGTGAYGSDHQKIKNFLALDAVSRTKYVGTLGSGIVGHLADFMRFEEYGHFAKLREEICTILQNKQALNFPIPFHALNASSISEKPHFYFLTLTPNPSAGKTSLCKYLGVEGYKGSSYNAKKVLGNTFLDRENYHFLFAQDTLCKKNQIDILTGFPDVSEI